jgi:hypothetical protein
LHMTGGRWSDSGGLAPDRMQKGHHAALVRATPLSR